MQDLCATEDIVSDGKVGVRFTFCVIGALSILMSSLVVLIMNKNPNLMHHPNRLVYYMCLAEGIACFNSIIAEVGIRDWLCYWGNAKVLSFTLGSTITHEDAFRRLMISNYTCMQFF
jgi:hypothetical protein